MRVSSRTVLAVLFALVTLPGAAPVNPPGSANSLVGRLLVAAPDIGDERFAHTVVLIVQHSQDGTLGIVINRPLGEQPIAKLLASTGQDDQGVSGNVRVFAGGPVEPWLGFIVHSGEYHREQTLTVDGHVAMTSSPEVLRDIGHNAGPQKSLVAFGYTGWGPGQLENELAQHGWYTIPEDPKLIFDDDPAKIWDDATARETVPL